MKPASAFRRNPRNQSGLHSYCRTCAREVNRRWREANRDYVEATNAARREGPFPKVCAVCGREFPASRRHLQVRCPDCQAELRSKRR